MTIGDHDREARERAEDRLKRLERGEHLGDGAYVSHDGFYFWLSANHHANRLVALEPQAVVHMVRWIKRWFPKLAEAIRKELEE